MAVIGVMRVRLEPETRFLFEVDDCDSLHRLVAAKWSRAIMIYKFHLILITYWSLQMKEREIIKIAISTEAKIAIDQACDRYGMSQIEMASRFYMWFAEQDEVLQAAILGILPKTVEVDVANLILERIADGQTSSFVPRPKKSRRLVEGTTRTPGRRHKKKSSA